jgi:hypothetical protein
VKPDPAQTPLFSPERYERRRGEIRLHMSHFFLNYLTDIYQAFEGDLAAAIILGEISHHNTARFFSPDQESNRAVRELQNEPAYWSEMDGCNAYSISCVTGIPRETVRRKISAMKNRGWLEDVPQQGLRITQACADHFGADFSHRFLNGLLRASRNIERLLSDETDAAKAPATVGRVSKPTPPTPTQPQKP